MKRYIVWTQKNYHTTKQNILEKIVNGIKKQEVKYVPIIDLLVYNIDAPYPQLQSITFEQFLAKNEWAIANNEVAVYVIEQPKERTDDGKIRTWTDDYLYFKDENINTDFRVFSNDTTPEIQADLKAKIKEFGTIPKEKRYEKQGLQLLENIFSIYRDIVYTKEKNDGIRVVTTIPTIREYIDTLPKNDIIGKSKRKIYIDYCSMIKQDYDYQYETKEDEKNIKQIGEIIKQKYPDLQCKKTKRFTNDYGSYCVDHYYHL